MTGPEHLLVLCLVGLLMLWRSRPGGLAEEVGGVLVLASILALPVGYAMGCFT
jgi:hypothetical protein